MTATVTFHVEGMHCGGCVRRVTNALDGVDGVHDVKVEVGRATFDAADDGGNVDAGIVDEAIAAVNALGFRVTHSP